MANKHVRIGLINPKSPDNVGSALRAAGNYRVEGVYYTGQRYPRALAHNPDLPKLRRSVSEGIPATGVPSILDGAAEGMRIVCIEFAVDATPLPDYTHPSNAYYVFGPEDGNISQSIIDQADDVVYIPTVGCMNMAATVNVLLYDRLSKSGMEYDSNELIQQSRDRNNNLKVR